MPATLLGGEQVCAQDVKPDHTSAPVTVPEQNQAPAVQLSAAYTADVRSDVAGGIRRGTRYLDNFDLTLAVDADRALGWRGGKLFAYGLYNNGVALSSDLSGDAQGLSNIETDVRAARLFELWVEQSFAHDHGSFRFGLYNLNSEFDTNPTASIFLLSSHGIGPEFAHSGRNGPSIFPVTSLALRAEIKVGDRLHLRGAVLDGVPGDPAHPGRTAIKLSARDGALGIGEVEYRDDHGKVGLGYWRYTAGFTDLLVSATAGRDVERRGNAGAYLLVERRLTSDLSTPRGLAGWARIGVANGRFNPIGEYVGGGLVYTGALRSRGSDQVGAALAWSEFGDRYRRAQAFLDQRRDAHEVIASATYLAPLTNWLSLQPSAAYVINPGGNPALRDALVLGLRVKVSR